MHYHIHIQGHLASGWQDRFAGLRIEQEEGGTTLLVGTLPDQAALYGVLLQLIRLGLILLSLETSQAGDRRPSYKDGSIQEERTYDSRREQEKR